MSIPGLVPSLSARLFATIDDWSIVSWPPRITTTPDPLVTAPVIGSTLLLTFKIAPCEREMLPRAPKESPLTFGPNCRLGRRTSPGEATLTRLMRPPGAERLPPVIVSPPGTETVLLVSGSIYVNPWFPPMIDRVWPCPTWRLLPWMAIAAGLGLINPKAATGALVRTLGRAGSA